MKIRRIRNRVRSILGPCCPALSEELGVTHTQPLLPFCSVMLSFEHVWISHSVMSNSLPPHGLEPVRLLCPCDFHRQVYRSGLPFPSPGGLPNPGFTSGSPTWQAESLLSDPQGNQIHQICMPGGKWTVYTKELSFICSLFQHEDLTWFPVPFRIYHLLEHLI